ncbi:inositol monophosphatase, partial [Patescibacteria group bacterium]|nr:inositol monophosphatase [Patescibacteria group bacterium]
KTCAQDFRTEADTGSEEVIVKMLHKAFPDHSIFSEECGMIRGSSPYIFYIDPLDGTNNFVIGIPNFSVSIALTKGKEALFGVVRAPLLDVTYYAAKGEGAFENGKKIRPSAETALGRSTSAFAAGYRHPKKEVMRLTNALSGSTKRTLWSWSLAYDLCLLASGRIETFVMADGAEPHDFLAGKLIAREAGCVASDFKGKPEKDDFNREFIASANPAIHRAVLPLI